tara:strand:+ start:845 stop:1228 length:384 start_codon:yes stop_codon:yes gene_type:complete
MEMIVIVSVLSTLGVVAMLTAIVVAFNKLKGKVDVKAFDTAIISAFNEIDEVKKENGRSNDIIIRDLNDNLRDVHQILNTDNTELRDGIYKELIDIRRFIDSRCDKLDNKIQTLTPAGESDKPLIKG